MKKIVYGPTITFDGMELSINANRKKGQGCYFEILQTIHTQLAAMQDRHSKIMTLRLDLHMAQYTPDSKLVSRFMKSTKRRLVRDYGLTDFGYVWAREKATADQQHYHLELIVDANKIQVPNKIIPMLEQIWQGMGQPKPYTTKNCYQVVMRNDFEGFNEAFYRASYLAKCYTKQGRAATANDYSASRLKRKYNNLVTPVNELRQTQSNF